ncbi:hypothetical protein PanWU01x14_187270 [Parasponia andersonii]|uniref:Uncharacterized protein n=1 Tax=Parasponia andersonii TaxID=3476 RepID=A0A2P5C3B8_PARAD|nr:hypothetical protein PanWU01x14_187270 [Parasponia andersonii]
MLNLAHAIQSTWKCHDTGFTVRRCSKVGRNIQGQVLRCLAISTAVLVQILKGLLVGTVMLYTVHCDAHVSSSKHQQ